MMQLANTPRELSPRSPTGWSRFISSQMQFALLCLAAMVGFISLQRLSANVELTITTAVTHLGEQYQAFQGNTHILTEAQRCKAPEADWADDLPNLQPISTFRSSKPYRQESVTIVTQFSLERIEALRSQCWMWQDHIAAVLYLPLLQNQAFSLENDTQVQGRSIESITRQLATFHTTMDGDPAACGLDLELVVENFDSSEDPKIGLYPFNAIRNRALMLAQSEAVFLLDADFLPSADFVKEYQDPLGYETMMNKLEKKVAIVLPAFGTANNREPGKLVATTAAMRGKDYVVSAYHDGKLNGFQIAKYAPGHTPTNYSKWMKTKTSYGVKYAKGYEPYVVVARKHVPWYDERFRGYGWDKITHLMHLAASGVHFAIHPRQFVVHVPHKTGVASKATKASGQYDKLWALYREVREGIANKTFAPVTSFSDVPRLCLPAEPEIQIGVQENDSQQQQEVAAEEQQIELEISDFAKEEMIMVARKLKWSEALI